MDNDKEKGGDKAYELGLWTATTVWLVMAAVIALNYANLPPVLPWFYSLPWGEGILIKKMWLWGVLGGAGVVLGGNMGLAVSAGKEEALVRRFLVWGAGVVELLVLLGLIKVMAIIL